MDSGIKTWKELFEIVCGLVTIFSLLGIWYSYTFSKKQIHFSTINKCINDFRDLIRNIDLNTEKAGFQYIDLVNEEFFYLEKGYLPLEISIEWIDGMIDHLPFITVDGTFRGNNKIRYFETELSTNVLMYEYPRVYKTIKLTELIDFEKIYLIPVSDENLKMRRLERNKLILFMISNLDLSKSKKRRARKILRKI
ncbi:hypothetical protein ACLI08_05530 [Flavobacterium sp. RNTU_13]|uniref:hypothetical protein n=1 Tax=Flavobacterium sp. RNTU_13 TaxID=3375145 RepID=UPI00398765A0